MNNKDKIKKLIDDGTICNKAIFDDIVEVALEEGKITKNERDYLYEYYIQILNSQEDLEI